MNTSTGTTTTITNNKEEKLRIAKHFLLSSPPGQFHLIAHDLHTIMMPQSNSSTRSVSMRGDVSVGTMSRTSRATTVRSSTGAGATVVEPLWSSEWLSEVQSAWERKLGNCGKDGNNDGNNNGNDDTEESPLYQCLQGHIKKHYSSKGVNAHVSLVPNANTSQVDILLYAERIQLSSSHAASWMGKFTYTYSTPSKQSNHQLSGQIQLRGHTFESGTVQSHYTSRPFCETIPSLSTSTSSFEESIPSLIAKWVQEVLDNVNQLYGELSSSILKQVRRILPVTRTKMDWNVQAVRLVQSMEQDVSRREES